MCLAKLALFLGIHIKYESIWKKNQQNVTKSIPRKTICILRTILWRIILEEIFEEYFEKLFCSVLEFWGPNVHKDVHLYMFFLS